jgi:hypothetical protein
MTSTSLIMLKISPVDFLALQKFIKQQMNVDVTFSRVGMDAPPTYSIDVTLEKLDLNTFRHLIYLIGYYMGHSKK